MLKELDANDFHNHLRIDEPCELLAIVKPHFERQNTRFRRFGLGHNATHCLTRPVANLVGAEGAAIQGGRFEGAANLPFLLWVFLSVRYTVHLNK